MDTKELLEKISEKSELSIQTIEELLTGLNHVIVEDCSNFQSIAIPGFGSFESKRRLERITVHPSTGRRMLIPPKIILSFRPSALLKQKIKN